MASISARTFRVVKLFPVVDAFIDIGLEAANGKHYVPTLDQEAGVYWGTRTVAEHSILQMPRRLTDALVAAATRDGAIAPAKHGQPTETI